MLIHKSDWLTITNKAEKTVEIDITGVIGGSFWDDEEEKSTINTKEKMRAELKAIAEIKAEKIIINIDSPGGSVWHGMSIHDLLAQHKATKETRIIGIAASIASVIAQAGDTRKISDNALFLIHRAMTIGMGNAKEIQVAIDDLNAIDAKIINIYTKRGADQDKINELMDTNNGNGRWIDGKEAKEIGLVDEVFEPMKAAATYDRELFNKLKYPEIPIEMTKKAEDTRSFFNKVKEAFAAAFKVEENQEPVIPQEVTDKLNEFDNQLKELEAENTTLSTQITDNESKVTELTEALAAKETELAAKVTELQAKETEILKLQARSTKPSGKIGEENTDPTPLTEYEKALAADVEKIKKLSSEIRD